MNLNKIIGQRHRQGRQTTDISWWPKPSIWESSGLNVGFWSSDCETWVLGRLKEIREGTAQLKSPSQWKSLLKFRKSSHVAAMKNDILSDLSLRAVL
jgi:hypothetical protein